MGSCKIQNHSSLTFLLFLVFYCHSHLTSSADIPHPHQCHALLQFKSSFVIDPSASDSITESWKESTDCCSWDGVTCDAESGHVTGLDLADSHIIQGTIHSNSSLFSSYLAPYLTHLDLSMSGFSGFIPSEISHLSNLVSLDLSGNDGLMFESERVVERIAHNLTQLRVLKLGRLNMSSIHVSSLMNLSSSLTSLTLSQCYLQGQLPASFLLRPSLQKLDLAYNNVRLITIPSSLSLPRLNSSSSLTLLDLRHNDLSASTGLLDFVGNHLKSLKILFLGDCSLVGSIPPSLGNLIELHTLYLVSNHLSGPIPPSLGNLTNLVLLCIPDNHLNGPIPTSFFNLTHLTYLALHLNELEGPIPSYLFALPSLTTINLKINKLHGQIPTSPVKPSSLTRLYLSDNNLSGIQDFDMFLNLEELDLSNNNLSSSTSIDVNLSYALPNLDRLYLSGCNLHRLPAFMKALTNLIELDVSNNQIQGSIPEWIYDVGKDTLSSIDLSGNRLTSVGRQLHWKNIYVIDFHSNLLQGPLPIPPPTTGFFSVSNNSLSGEISSLICNLSQCGVLDLSRNRFTGSIPKCLGRLGDLSVLNLGMNNLHGLIPNTFAKHSSLNTLVLNGNQLTGRLPQTLSYCSNLEILDVGNNVIEDTVPHWLETLSSLEVLVLRSNKFYGSLNSFKVKLPNLRILDISNNNFTSQLPVELMRNLQAMMTKAGFDSMYIQPSDMEFYYSLVLTVKGNDMGYVKVLTTLVTIDLSRNKFEGHIPEIIGKLISLKGLNLSHNLLTGHIPSSMGDLGNLEWLDLSHNKLNGQIPRELTDLNFLEVLDLSTNQLHGAVPHGKQFNTFGNDSYKDNLALCGFPLSKACGSNHEPPSGTSEDESSSDSEGGFNWKGAFAGYGCGVVFGVSMGYLMFTTGSPKWFVKMVEGKQRKRFDRRSKRHGRARK